MSQPDQSPRGFWRPTALITALAALLGSTAALFGAFGDLGIFGTAGGDGQPARQEPVMTGSSSDKDATVTAGGPGSGNATITADSISGAWAGTTARGNTSFRVTLSVVGGCTINKPCGRISVVKCDGDITQHCTISVKAPRCAGDVALQGVVQTTVELYVYFPPDAPDGCKDDRGHFFRPLGEDALRYETDFGLEGTLTRRSA